MIRLMVAKSATTKHVRPSLGMDFLLLVKFLYYFFGKFLFKFYPKTPVSLGASFLAPGNPGIADKTIFIVVIKNNVCNCFVDFRLVYGLYKSTALAYILEMNCVGTASNTCIDPEEYV